jgi:hypothetical protein
VDGDGTAGTQHCLGQFNDPPVLQLMLGSGRIWLGCQRQSSFNKIVGVDRSRSIPHPVFQNCSKRGARLGQLGL